MGELVEERADGRIAVEVFHSAQLGEEKDTIEQSSARETANERVIHQFVHPDAMPSCQLVVGMTRLGQGRSGIPSGACS